MQARDLSSPRSLWGRSRARIASNPQRARVVELERKDARGGDSFGCDLLNAAAIVAGKPAIGSEPHRAIAALSYRAHVIRRQPVKQSHRAPLMKI